MYEAGKILYVGGGGDPNWDTPGTTNRSRHADRNGRDRSTSTAYGSPMAGSRLDPTPRRHLNATVLPNGQGARNRRNSAGRIQQSRHGSHARGGDLDPPTEYVDHAREQHRRSWVSSVSLLLPDATVLHGGAATPTSRHVHSVSRLKRTTRSSSRRICSRARGRPSPTRRARSVMAPPIRSRRRTPRRSPRCDSFGLGSVTHAFDQNGRAIDRFIQPL